jgi:hypothetical protein
MFKTALASLGILTSLASAPMPVYAGLTSADRFDLAERNASVVPYYVATIDEYLTHPTVSPKPTSAEEAESIKSVKTSITWFNKWGPECNDAKVINLARANISDGKMILTRFQSGDWQPIMNLAIKQYTSTHAAKATISARQKALIAKRGRRRSSVTKRYADSLVGAPASRGRRLKTLKSFLSFATRMGYLPFNAGAAIHGPALEQKLAERILSERQVFALLEAVEDRPRDHALIRLHYNGGLRMSELVRCAGATSSRASRT